jgi:transposase-like protein
MTHYNYPLDKPRRGVYIMGNKNQKGEKPMKFIPPKFKKLSQMAAIDVGRLTEDEARAILESVRWPKGIECPHCKSEDVVRIAGKAEKVRDGLLRCKDCRKQFTVTVGTVMERSHITLRQWVQAFHSMCSHKKGVSSLQLQRNLGLRSYRSAWHLTHRIRLAMKEDPLMSLLSGIVEVDETYIGGKPRKGGSNGEPNKRGRGTKKTPVMAMVERDGKVISKPLANVTGKTLKAAIREAVNDESRIITDEFYSYNGIGKEFKGGHQVVVHSMGEYSRGDVFTNTAESYFALLKRGVNGTFHHISKKHLAKYCNEFAFRWDNRKITDGERAEEAVKGMGGKRLLLKDLLGHGGEN